MYVISYLRDGEREKRKRERERERERECVSDEVSGEMKEHEKRARVRIIR